MLLGYEVNNCAECGGDSGFSLFFCNFFLYFLYRAINSIYSIKVYILRITTPQPFKLLQVTLGLSRVYRFSK